MSTLARMMLLGTALAVCLCAAIASAAGVGKGGANDRDEIDNDRRGPTERSSRSNSDNSRGSNSGPAAANRDDARNRNSATGWRQWRPRDQYVVRPKWTIVPVTFSRSWMEQPRPSELRVTKIGIAITTIMIADYRDDRDGNYGYANPYISRSHFFPGPGRGRRQCRSAASECQRLNLANQADRRCQDRSRGHRRSRFPEAWIVREVSGTLRFQRQQ